MDKVAMIEELMGKSINVWTINSNFQGTVTEIEGEWIKLVSGGKKPSEYILKSDMITSITVFPNDKIKKDPNN